MPEPKAYIANGAIIECTQGLIPKRFTVDKNPSTTIGNETFATIEDKEIPDFGICKLKRGFNKKCSPRINKWLKFDPTGINNEPTLMRESCAMCIEQPGGIIKFKNSGQSASGFVKANGGGGSWRFEYGDLYEYDPEFGDLIESEMKALAEIMDAHITNGTLNNDNIPADISLALSNLANKSGIPLTAMQSSFYKFAEIVNEKGIRPDLIDNGDKDFFYGSTQQLRFGKVVGDSLGLDPIFGALLRPDGGLTGPAEGFMYNNGDGIYIADEALAMHSAAHDAAGFLYSKFGLGPGYCYSPGGCSDVSPMGTDHPYSGQVEGIAAWLEYVGFRKGKEIAIEVKDGIIHEVNETIDAGEDIIEEILRTPYTDRGFWDRIFDIKPFN